MNDSIIKMLEKNLADTYVLKVNIQKCHWNVEGPRFHSLHVMFEAQYRVLFEYIDTIAERIRALGAYSPGTFKEFDALSNIAQIEEKKLAADVMIERLLKGYETLVKNMQATAEAAGEKDKETADMMTGQNITHQKNMWMLRSILQDKE